MGSRILYEVNYKPIIEYNIFMFIISSILVYIYREEIQKIIDDLKDWAEKESVENYWFLNFYRNFRRNLWKALKNQLDEPIWKVLLE